MIIVEKNEGPKIDYEIQNTATKKKITFDDDPHRGTVDVIIPLSAEPLEILGERVLNSEVNLVLARDGVLVIATNDR